MARPEQEVAEELSRLNCRVDKQQLKALAQALTTGEAVLDAVSGRGEPNVEPRSSRVALVVTASEILQVSLDDRWSEGSIVRRLYWPDVARLDTPLYNNHSFETGIELTGYSSTGHVCVSYDKRACPADEFAAFVQRLQERVAAVKSASNASVAKTGDALVAQLERLANLRERGHISNEEFELAKKRLLQR